MKHEDRINIIKEEFKSVSRVLNVIGEENRQKILFVLLDGCQKGGIRVEEIAKKINLSRPATSHHLKILKDENLVSIRKEGTKNYYYISGVDQILKLRYLVDNIDMLVKENEGVE